jgi:glycosyltransferase involved in cell wall biosynthesis
MRVGIDGYNLALREGTGVATYARTLARSVHALGWPVDLLYGLSVSPKSRLAARETLFFDKLGEGDSPGPPRKSNLRRMIVRTLAPPGDRQMVSIPITGRVVATGFSDRLPALDRLFTLGDLFNASAGYFRRHGRFMTVRLPDPPAVMHWTYPLPIRLAGAANVYTIHDLVPLRLPYTSLEDKAYFDALIGACLRTADHIVTVSENSRRDILDLFPIDASRVTNTYQPIDTPIVEEAPQALGDRLQRLFDLPRDGYFLFFGAIEPKKNLGRLIEAYLDSGVETPLVIVGAGGWRSDQELRLLNGAHGKRLIGTERIRIMDYLPRPRLMELIRGARAVVFPALYEGFGLPAAEALALGVPLIASNTGSMPEIVGEAAVTVDPYDVAALSAALRQVDSDADLRARLSAAGPIQAARFSQARYQEALAGVYGALGEGAKG